jgi:hypothetical protein
LCPKNICKKIYIENPETGVAAGFIPALISIRAGFQAGINPAATNIE